MYHVSGSPVVVWINTTVHSQQENGVELSRRIHPRTSLIFNILSSNAVGGLLTLVTKNRRMMENILEVTIDFSFGVHLEGAFSEYENISRL